MADKRKIIIITDGDEYAKRAVERVARDIGGRCISLSHGNPTALTGREILQLIKMAPYDPVLVMFDDSGLVGEGPGELALKYIARHQDIEVLGLIAVASNTRQNEWSRVHVSIDREGEIIPYGVDKNGLPEIEMGMIHGDTVYCIDQLEIPIVVGIGDIGKMDGRDHADKGSPVTRKAVELILERSGYNESLYGTPFIDEGRDELQ
ncbi:stage V sporulation protein AE [Peribacillus kribbensis]|uniref:stage V sporulation protein AE n=1 Tax=Peribacillus kribbensis TaxID=356658 RepID=UPI000412D12E|nr:stage V sporulation protein AE [Peribacillus kribbensis]